MTEDQAKNWMQALADSGDRAPLPDFDRLWAMRRLKEEFERRRRMTAPLEWMDIALQSAAGSTAAALLVWWATLA